MTTIDSTVLRLGWLRNEDISLVRCVAPSFLLGLTSLRVGELFSVSPYMAKRLENLFVLNERVALLGRWKYGFFGMVPVGATNVGSIKINFDKVGLLNHIEAVFTNFILAGTPYQPPWPSTASGHLHRSSILCRIPYPARPTTNPSRGNRWFLLRKHHRSGV